MHTVKIKINIPESLDEITLGQYQKFFAISKDFDDNEETIFLQQKMVQIFCNIELSFVAQMRYNDVIDICNKLNNLFAGGDKFIDRFALHGVAFGFIPNLDDMTFGEYSNLDEYINDFETMHKAMAVMFRPIKKEQTNGKYLIVAYDGTGGTCEVMKDAPLSVVFGAMVFFWDLGNELLKATLIYLETIPEVANLVQPDSSVKSGDGTQVFTRSQMEDLKTLKGRQDFRFTNV